MIGRCFAATVSPCLVDVECHLVEFLQKIVWKLDVGLVDFINQKHHAFIGIKGFPELAALDVVANVVHAFFA